MKTTSLNQSSSLCPNIVISSTQSKNPRKRPATQALQADKNKRSNKSIPQLMAVSPILQQAKSVDDLSPPPLELQYRSYDQFWKAVTKDDVSSLQNLLTPETSLNARYGKNGWTLLKYAVQLGHVDIVNFLIQQGVDIQAQNLEEGWSALHLACSHYSKKRSKERILILQSLMKAGANLNQVTKGGWTPLHWAAQQGSYNSVQCLIHEGAEVNASTSYEETPGERGLTPLLLAIRNRHDDIVELLLNNGADPNQKSADHIGPLQFAIAGRQPAIINLLARKKANVNIKISNAPQKKGMTLLHLALLRGNLESVRSLIEAGADVNQRSGDAGWIPLQLTDNIDMINILLENSEIQINATSRDQWSALHWHVDENNLPIVELLLEKKPDLSLKTEAGDTPLDLAKKNGNPAMIAKIQDAIPQKITNPLPIHAGSDHIRTLTPLPLAIRHRHDNVVELLLDNGADPNQKIADHIGLFQLAGKKANVNIKISKSRDQLLLEKKPDLSLKTETGDLPVDLAKKIGDPAMIAKIQDAIPQKVTNPLPIKKRFSSLTVGSLMAPYNNHETILQHTTVILGTQKQDPPQHHHTPEEFNIARVIAYLNTATLSQSMHSTPSPMSQPSSMPTPRVSVIVHTEQFL